MAQDGDGGNSPFVTALSNDPLKPNVEIGKLFRLVRDDVAKATNGQQEPFTDGSLPGEDFIFNPAKQSGGRFKGRPARPWERCAPRQRKNGQDARAPRGYARLRARRALMLSTSARGVAAKSFLV